MKLSGRKSEVTPGPVEPAGPGDLEGHHRMWNVRCLGRAALGASAACVSGGWFRHTEYVVRALTKKGVVGASTIFPPCGSLRAVSLADNTCSMTTATYDWPRQEDCCCALST